MQRNDKNRVKLAPWSTSVPRGLCQSVVALYCCVFTIRRPIFFNWRLPTRTYWGWQAEFSEERCRCNPIIIKCQFCPLRKFSNVVLLKKEKNQNNGWITRDCYFQTWCTIFWWVILLRKWSVKKAHQSQQSNTSEHVNNGSIRGPALLFHVMRRAFV